jgi:hypothetical protein
MTLVRRLALGISSRVVRWASRGCKEWAEGLAREATVIESDWAALGWALGSTRVLLNFREARLATLADVPSAVKKFAELKRNESCNGIALIALFLFGNPLLVWMGFVTAPSSSTQIGCGMAVFFRFA